MNISAGNLGYRELNNRIRVQGGTIRIPDCLGQRFIGSGMNDINLTINGTPGNALGSYLNGGVIHVNGNTQDAVGDTMNDGRIIIHGSAGDALGYAMRGGAIFVRDNTGYRAGVHMKEYKDKKPVIIIGGAAGSFLGEYLAGGLIIVLGINSLNELPIGNFTGTGMHGGRIYIRTNRELTDLPAEVDVKPADDLSEILPFITEFAEIFDINANQIMSDKFYVLSPNAKNPYHQLYTAN